MTGSRMFFEVHTFLGDTTMILETANQAEREFLREIIRSSERQQLKSNMIERDVRVL